MVVLDYEAHEDQALREQQADLWLGFERGASSERLAKAAGLVGHPLAAPSRRMAGRGPRPAPGLAAPHGLPQLRINGTTRGRDVMNETQERTRSPTSSSPTGAARRSASPRRRCPASWRCATSTARRSRSKGARIAGCLHMTIQTAVLIETLTRARRRGHLDELQHLLDAGPRRRRHRRRRRAGLRLEGRDARGVRLVPRAAAQGLRGRQGPEHDPRRRRRPHRRGSTRSTRELLHRRGPHPRPLGGDDHGRAPPLRDVQDAASSSARPSTSTTRSPSASSTTSTAAASRSATASSARPT